MYQCTAVIQGVPEFGDVSIGDTRGHKFACFLCQVKKGL